MISKAHLESSRGFLCVTFFAVNRLAFCWLERNFTFLSAFRANCFVHLSWAEISSKSAASAVCHVRIILLMLGIKNSELVSLHSLRFDQFFGVYKPLQCPEKVKSSLCQIKA